jgi:hypothetical protein
VIFVNVAVYNEGIAFFVYVNSLFAINGVFVELGFVFGLYGFNLNGYVFDCSA